MPFLTIAVSRYDEKINLDKYVSKYENGLIIYNKGDVIENIKNQEEIQIIPLKNVGRESQTYVHHIISNYETLSPVTIFLQANYEKHIGEKHIDDLIESAINDPSGLSQNALRHEVGPNNASTYFTIAYHMNQKVTPSSEYSNFGEWITKITGSHLKSSPRWYIGANFAATREAIHRVPLDIWQKIQTALSYDINPVTGHFMERSWYYLLNNEFQSIQQNIL